VPEISATDAARNFSDILDAVEHRGEHFTIVRRGRVVAQLDPVSAGRGADVKAILLRGRHRDPAFRRDIESVRELLEIETRS
jgi:prevent-host-death family protein